MLDSNCTSLNLFYFEFLFGNLGKLWIKADLTGLFGERIYEVQH